ncbi:MAG: aminotransferase class V-fold PLP-dependent enzyme [Symbiopectobacterium sp.]
MEAVREQVARYINAVSAEEIVFVRGTTEASCVVPQKRLTWSPPATAVLLFKLVTIF